MIYLWQILIFRYVGLLEGIHQGNGCSPIPVILDIPMVWFQKGPEQV